MIWNKTYFYFALQDCVIYTSYTTLFLINYTPTIYVKNCIHFSTLATRLETTVQIKHFCLSRFFYTLISFDCHVKREKNIFSILLFMSIILTQARLWKTCFMALKSKTARCVDLSPQEPLDLLHAQQKSQNV
jgi:hypothetical protein